MTMECNASKWNDDTMKVGHTLALVFRTIITRTRFCMSEMSLFQYTFSKIWDNKCVHALPIQLNKLNILFNMPTI